MGQSTKMSNTGLQQQGSAANGAANGASPAMGPSVTGSATVGNPTQGGPKKARSGYNAKAMERIRDSLRPFEDNNPTHIGHLNMGNLVGMQNGSITVATAAPTTGVRPVSSLSTGSSSNSNYSECIQSLMTFGFDEVGHLFLIEIFFTCKYSLYTHNNVKITN